MLLAAASQAGNGLSTAGKPSRGGISGSHVAAKALSPRDNSNKVNRLCGYCALLCNCLAALEGEIVTHLSGAVRYLLTLYTV